MASLSAVIVPAKVLKNGQHKIRIAVAHNGTTRYLITDILIDSPRQFKNGAIVKRPDAAYLNTKLRGILQRYQSMIDEMQYVNGLTCPELVWQLNNGMSLSRRTLASIFDEYITTANISESSKHCYGNAYTCITSVISERTIMDNISYGTIMTLDSAFRKRGLSSTTIRNYMTLLAILVSYAEKCGYVSYRVSPFRGYKKPENKIRDSWLTIDEIRKIRDIEISNYKLSRYRDLFMLSYYLGGINLVDLLKINFKECCGTLKYVRQKIANRTANVQAVEFEIPEEAKSIISKLINDKGYICRSKGSNLKRGIPWSTSHYMIKLSELTGIEKLIYYSARKSFSQHAFELGINTSIIDYILGHSIAKSGSCLYAYITVSPDMATAAIRKVLDNLRGDADN